MGNPRLSSPLVTVIREGHDPITVQTDNRDLLLWDTTRVKHKWPRFDEVPNLWLTFVAWAAARRTGAIPTDYKWEQWREAVIDVDAEERPEDDDAGDPFLEGLEPGS